MVRSLPNGFIKIASAIRLLPAAVIRMKLRTGGRLRGAAPNAGPSARGCSPSFFLGGSGLSTSGGNQNRGPKLRS